MNLKQLILERAGVENINENVYTFKNFDLTGMDKDTPSIKVIKFIADGIKDGSVTVEDIKGAYLNHDTFLNLKDNVTLGTVVKKLKNEMLRGNKEYSGEVGEFAKYTR